MIVFADAWTGVSAVAAAIAAAGSCAAAWITRSQWAKDREERYKGVLLALRLECEQVWSVWHHSVAILRTQNIAVWNQHATEIAVRYPEVAMKMKDAAAAVELTNWFMDMRHEPMPVETENLGIDAVVKERHRRTNTAREAAQGAAIKLDEVVVAINAAQGNAGRK